MKLKKRKERRERPAPTWVDFLLLVLVTGAVFFGWLYLRSRRRAADPNVAIAYLLCVPGVDTTYLGTESEASALIPKGGSVRVANGTASLGRVSEVWIERHAEPKIEKGEMILAEDPQRVDLYIEVRGDAVAKRGDGLRISDVRIAAGGRGDFRVGGFMAEAARVISVRKEGAK